VEHYVAERYLPAGRAGSFAADLPGVRDRSTELGGVRLVSAVYLPSEETCFYLFESESADLVAQASAGLGVDRILAAVAVDA
jgi:hypothetical protein